MFTGRQCYVIQGPLEFTGTPNHRLELLVLHFACRQGELTMYYTAHYHTDGCADVDTHESTPHPVRVPNAVNFGELITIVLRAAIPRLADKYNVDPSIVKSRLAPKECAHA